MFYALKDFQISDYTMSDFILRWMRMVTNLEKIADGLNNFTSKLLEALNLRSNLLNVMLLLLHSYWILVLHGIVLVMKFSTIY